MSKIIRKEMRQPGVVGMVIRFLFWAGNFGMALSFIGGINTAYVEYQKIPPHLTYEQDVHVAGATIVLMILLVGWVLFSIIFGVLILLTRGEKVIVEERVD